MLLQRNVIFAALAVGIAALPLSPAKAQYYGPPCDPFPLAWPFCIVGAAVGTAATVVSAPFRPGPYYYSRQPYYGAPAYYGDGHQPWNRPSPTDRVARQLNRQELARTNYGY